MTRRYPPLLDELGRGAPVSLVPVSGGCIAAAAIAGFADGSDVFVKTAQKVPGLFAAEAQGLRELAAAAAIRVPRVLAVGEDGLVLERIREGPKPAGFFEAFGRAFAALHRHRGPACGFRQDNFIGATPQPNRPPDGDWGEARPEGTEPGSRWPAFFIDRRLRFQAKLAANRSGGAALGKMLDRAERRIAVLLEAATEPPSLLHGDLWGGNYLVDAHGKPVLIDPAVYYGHREADLAMTRLFGGFAPAFYAAYHEVMPLAPGHEARSPVYQLYHVMNHFNLFGGGYLEQAKRMLERYM